MTVSRRSARPPVLPWWARRGCAAASSIATTAPLLRARAWTSALIPNPATKVASSNFLSRRRSHETGRLRQPRKLFRLRLPLLALGRAELLRFLGHVVKHRGVAGEFLHAGHAVELGVESGLQAADRQRAVFQNPVRPRHPLGLEFSHRHDLVDEAHGGRLGRVVLAAEEPDLARLLLAYEAREVARAEAAVEAAHLRTDLAEDRVVGRDGEVADHMQHVAAADGVTGDERDDDLGHRADELLDVENVEPRHARVVDVAAVPAHRLVTAGAKGVLAVLRRARAREEHDTDLLVLPRVEQGRVHLDHRLRPEGVALLRAVDGDAGDAAGLVVEDVLVFFRGFPSE